MFENPFKSSFDNFEKQVVKEITSVAPPADFIPSVDGQSFRAGLLNSISERRNTISEIINKKNNNLLIILNESATHIDEVIRNAEKIRDLNVKYATTLHIVVLLSSPFEVLKNYNNELNIENRGSKFFKSRSIFNEFNIAIQHFRRLLSTLDSYGISVGMDISDLLVLEYFSDLLVWGRIQGAETRSQKHIELASSLSFPIAFSTSNSVTVENAIEAIQFAKHSHTFLSMHINGSVAIKQSTGNPNCVLVLAERFAIDFESQQIYDTSKELTNTGINSSFLIDFSSKLNQSTDYSYYENLLEELALNIAVSSSNISGLIFQRKENKRDVNKENQANILSINQVLKDSESSDSWQDISRILELFSQAIHTRRGDKKSYLTSEARADKLENLAVELLSEGRVKEAHEKLIMTLQEEPIRAARLLLEFGFLLNSDYKFFDEIFNLSNLLWPVKLWQEISARSQYHTINLIINTVPLSQSSLDSNSSITTLKSNKKVTQASIERQNKKSHILGAELENGFLLVLKNIFLILQDTEIQILKSMRKQNSGLQFGHDLAFTCDVADFRNVRCHVECKNYLNSITLKDIAEKLLQQEMYWRNLNVDHWILISPHSDPTNELSLMLDYWAAEKTFPFSVQIWSPENGVHQLFGLVPSVFDNMYTCKDSHNHPSKWSETERINIRALWMSRITPLSRFTKQWEKYIRSPEMLCCPGEDNKELEALYSRHVELNATSSIGLPLTGSLESNVSEWICEKTKPVLILLGEFGDGKTSFGYTLSRKLLNGVLVKDNCSRIPLRLRLKDYHLAGSARALLELRLAEIGCDIASWLELCRSPGTLIILDGFDEMSHQLDPESIRENVNGLLDCSKTFVGSKMLVTSRSKFFDEQKDLYQLQKRLDGATVIQIAPIRRIVALGHLRNFARARGSIQKLESLQRLYDPVGLASKPLFLQMIESTLDDLPDVDIDSVSLYETYVTKSLRHKLDSLSHPNGIVYPSQIEKNIEKLLEDISFSFACSNNEYVSLADFRGETGEGISELLWKMSHVQISGNRNELNSSFHADATARVGIRSLLITVSGVDPDKWPVTFFHRSIQEYLLARKIVRSLLEGIESGASHLKRIQLSTEVINFAVSIMRRSPDKCFEPTLVALIRSSIRGLIPTPQGGNAITLLYGLLGRIPKLDWSNLHLDGARLPGADLTSMNFSNSSLQGSNLDNANLSWSDFRGAILKGVRLEETTAIQALSIDVEGEIILAGYSDGSIREWLLSRGSRPISKTLVSNCGRHIICVTRTSKGSILVVSDGHCVIYEVNSPNLPSIRFRISDRISSILVTDDLLTFTQNLSGGDVLLTTSHLVTNIRSQYKKSNVLTFFEFPHGFLAIVDIKSGTLSIARNNDSDDVEILFDLLSGVSVISAKFLESENNWHLGAGDVDGSVRVWVINIKVSHLKNEWVIETPKKIFDSKVHEGTVIALALSGRGNLISAGPDRAIAHISYLEFYHGTIDLQIERIHLTLQCEGIDIDGLEGNLEHSKLSLLRNRKSEC